LTEIPSDHGFKSTWNVSRFRFGYLTLGTLLVIVFVGMIGYLAAASVRRQTVTTDLGGAAAEGVATQPAG
jgi:1,4-dihydroxy-2-naphthoate octaprenyltransferase